jgi:hypothetical protein
MIPPSDLLKTTFSPSFSASSFFSAQHTLLQFTQQDSEKIVPSAILNGREHTGLFNKAKATQYHSTMKTPSTSDLLSCGENVLQLDSQLQTSSPIDDPESCKKVPKARYCPPSSFQILSLCILFLCITAVVAGTISGDWEASFCTFPSSPFPSKNLIYWTAFADEVSRCDSSASHPRSMDVSRKSQITRNEEVWMWVSRMEYWIGDEYSWD